MRIGESLHPREHAERHPKIAAVFQSLRDGVPLGGFAATAERFRHAGDTVALVAHLRQRPGELWRRADDTLRHAVDPTPVVRALVETVDRASLPLLLQVGAQLPLRDVRWPVRVFFPAGAFFVAPSAKDRRAALSPETTAPIVAAIEAELLSRFAVLPPVRSAVIDEAIASIVVPFNERTAARSAVVLPRGSTLRVPESDKVRLFLHWCEPRGATPPTSTCRSRSTTRMGDTGVCRTTRVT